MNLFRRIIRKIQRNLSGESWAELDRALYRQEYNRFMLDKRILCKLGKHSFYQAIGGHDSEGFPYPCKACRYCDYNEDLR